MDTQDIIQITHDAINMLSTPVSIDELNSVIEFKEWIQDQKLPSKINTIRFSPIYMVDLFSSFDLSEFKEKEEKEYTTEEYINQVMNYIGYTSIYDLTKKKHPKHNPDITSPCVWFDSQTSAYLIIGEIVYKFNPTTGKINTKITHFFS